MKEDNSGFWLAVTISLFYIVLFAASAFGFIHPDNGEKAISRSSAYAEVTRTGPLAKEFIGLNQSQVIADFKEWVRTEPIEITGLTSNAVGGGLFILVTYIGAEKSNE